MDERPPLWRNLRWPQLAFGLLVGIVGFQLWQHARGVVILGAGGLVLRVLGLATAALVFLVYLQNVHKYGIVPDYSKLCRFCNGPVNRYSEFCEHCGADLIAPEKLVPCSKCGAELYEGTSFCPECGASASGGGKKKGKKKQRQEPPQEGWDEPIDALTGLPPPRDER